jgi:hypothetical protein
VPPVNPFSLLNMAQRSRLLRWLLGLSGFSLMPSKPQPRPGEDPMQRLRVRLMTSLSGVLAGVISLILWAAGGIALWVGQSHRPAGWTLLVGGGVMLLLAGRSVLQCRAGRMPVPGAIIVAIVLDLAALAAAGWILWK